MTNHPEGMRILAEQRQADLINAAINYRRRRQARAASDPRQPEQSRLRPARRLLLRIAAPA
jgi:hypothetical protein